MNLIRYRVSVNGRVQGVFYRASTVEQANLLGLTGWVCNQTDGSVLIEVQGLKSKVEKFIAWSKLGPRNAKVDNISLDTRQVVLEQNFVIRY